MRLFVALELDQAVRTAAATVIERLRERALHLAPRSRITWATADRLHVTVRFIGHVDAATDDDIRRALAVPLEHDPFRIQIKGVGTFPLTGTPRVVWAGVGEGRVSLTAIENEVSERLVARGLAREERPYNPHLTLARVREPAGLRPAPLLESVKDQAFGSVSVEAITLFESRLSPKGPAYVVLQRTAFVASSCSGLS
jgi:2'-5' RNA ligase